MRNSIEDNDLLGRAVFSNSRMKKAVKGHITHDIFLQKPGLALSVDRFGFCKNKQLTKIQDQNAKLRSKINKCSFYGWAKIKTLMVRRNGRKVNSTPKKTNPYHADITLPKDIERDEQITHAKEMASYANWEPRYIIK